MQRLKPNQVAYYNEAITAAQGLLREQIRNPQNETNSEYTRGVVEILADIFPQAAYMDDSKRIIAERIGVKLEGME